MRGRNKPWAKDFIEEHNDLLFTTETLKNFDALTLEIGIGKGDFIIANAKYHPDMGHIGVEMNTSIFAIAMKKLVTEGIHNVALLNCPANKLAEVIGEESITTLHLNFSDPWPQNGYRKRRLVHPLHLELFEKLLKNNGRIIFKTDNEKLFEMGVENFKIRNYHIEFYSDDYQTVEGDFVSEYEAKFRQLNVPIHRCVVVVDKNDLHPWGDAIK